MFVNSMTEDELLAIDLAEPTSDANRQKRIKMVRSLAHVAPGSPAAHLLLRFIHENDFQLNLQSLEVLKQRLDIAKKYFGELLVILRGLTSGWKRTIICEILTQAGVEKDEFLATLHQLDNKDESIAGAIWKITGKIELIKPILEGLLKEPREETCDLICEIGPNASFTAPALAGALASHDADLRWATACALGALGTGARLAIPNLIRALSDGSGLVAGCAAHALASIGTSAVPSLIDALKSNITRTKEFAADALANIGECAKDAVPRLNELLNDPSEDVVLWASIALGEIARSQQALPILEQAEKRPPSESVRQRIRRAIDKIKYQA